MRTFGIGLTAVIIAVFVGKLYMRLTRPDVPVPVAAMLTRYAPGVMIGDDVADARQHLTDVHFVSHLGFVGELPDTGAAENSTTRTQVRLLLDSKSRSRTARRAEGARVDAVELVFASGTSYFGGFYELERMGPPSGTGCVKLESPGNFREVQYWETPNKRAGVAVVIDYARNVDKPHPDLYLSSAIFFLGPFDGGRTLRANYEPHSCRRLERETA